ncbi:MAG: hypothetical protein COB15_09685 [Flavobacteriales bacterium]|nr:MAG: hypothetical protein COB15_09685 [Flavobacteriales bacterium]
MIHVGIDPGADGAIGVIDAHLTTATVFPKISGKFDAHQLNICIERILEEDDYIHFILEKPGIIFGVGKSSMAKLYKNCGLIEGILIGNNCRYTLVPPKEWQKEMWQGVDTIRKSTTKRKKDGTKAQGAVDTKAMSLMAAKRLWPSMDFRKSERATTPHDGIVDALLMAEYSRRKF